MILLAKISYNDPDSNTNVLPNFTPNCTPGNHFKNFKQTHNSLTNLLVYLVFTDKVLRTIPQHTD